MAATLAQGTTILENCACEPEIVDLAISLRSMGAEISGEGTPTMTIQGVSRLRGMNHRVAPDRIEAATYLCAGLMTRGKVRTLGIGAHFMESALTHFRAMGAQVHSGPDFIEVNYQRELSPVSIVTEPFPGFPTDMQAQFMAVLTQAQGQSEISETIFENRFMHVPELARLGAKISIQGNKAIVSGPTPLSGAIVMATDLRASASLIIAGLAAKGETHLRRIYHLDRGYERLETKFQNIGAKVTREHDV
jgi:UDP-N-acetylglucosamine 1-carboxyvinyltransferase